MTVLKNITGKRFGRLIAIRLLNERQGKGKRTAWKCRCDCGNLKIITLDHLTRGTKSCGCIHKEFCFKGDYYGGSSEPENLTGLIFGWLIAVRMTNLRMSGQAVWECECRCGNTVTVASHNLKTQHIRSCGCRSIISAKLRNTPLQPDNIPLNLVDLMVAQSRLKKELIYAEKQKRQND